MSISSQSCGPCGAPGTPLTDAAPLPPGTAAALSGPDGFWPRSAALPRRLAATDRESLPRRCDEAAASQLAGAVLRVAGRMRRALERVWMGNRLAAAEAALKAGRPAEAVEQIEAALAESSNRSAQVYRVLARNLYRLDRFVEGAAAVARGLAKHPRDAELWNLRGVMLRKLGRHSEALEALDEAVKIDPRQDSYQVNRGIVLLNLRDAAAAEKVFARLVRKAPGSVDLRRRLGQSLRLQGRNEAAIVQFSEAAEIEPGNVDASLDLAGTLSDLGRLADAEATLDAAFSARGGLPAGTCAALSGRCVAGAQARRHRRRLRPQPCQRSPPPGRRAGAE